MLVLRFFCLVFFILMLELLLTINFLEHLFSDFQKLNKNASTLMVQFTFFCNVVYNLSVRPCVLQLTSLVDVLFLSRCAF